jgi:hypothetical protein
MREPIVSVVVVSDYAGGTPGSLEDYRHCLAALAAQDFDEPVEFILSEWDGFRDSISSELRELLPSLQPVFSDARTSFGLKNAGARAARAPIVAILDADCDPAPSWLRSAVDTLRSHPEVAAVSGRSLSPNRTRRQRIMSLAGRAVGDEGTAGPTRHVSLNNIAYRREVILDHPLSSAAGSCGFAFHSGTLLREGHQLWFDPGMEVVHDDMAFAATRDVRRQMGLSIVLTRMLDPRQPYSWLVRLRYASIPVFVVGKTLLTAKRVIQRRAAQGVRWYEVPASIAAGFVHHLLEIPGMILAFRGEPIRATNFR